MDADRLRVDGSGGASRVRVSNVRKSSGLRPVHFRYAGIPAMVLREIALPSWLYSSGKIEPVLAKPGNYSSPRLSPDGTRLALSVIQEGKQSLWVYDLRRETWNRLTSEDGPELLPTWTPDGEFLAFRSGNTLAWTRSDGSGKVERLAGVSRKCWPMVILVRRKVACVLAASTGLGPSGLSRWSERQVRAAVGTTAAAVAAGRIERRASHIARRPLAGLHLGCLGDTSRSM